MHLETRRYRRDPHRLVYRHPFINIDSGHIHQLPDRKLAQHAECQKRVQDTKDLRINHIVLLWIG